MVLPKRNLQAGAAKSNITPRLGVSINGGMRDRTAEHIHDELHARALVLDNGHMQLAIVICDSCLIPAEVFEAAKHLAHSHTKIPTDRMLLAATHTHSAPTVAGVFQSERDLDYQEFLAIRISDAIRRAVHNLAPARVAWGVGQLASEVHNRRWRMREGFPLVDPFGNMDQVRMNPPRASADLREPAGPIDPQIVVLAVEHADGRPLALLANYALHYVGGIPGDTVSADYFGVFCDRIAQLLRAERQDPPFVGLLSNGTSGDINNINFRQPAARRAPYQRMRRVADKVASEVQRVYRNLTFTESPSLAMKQTQLTLGVRRPTSADVQRAKQILANAQPGEQLRTPPEIYARETLLMADWPAKITTVLQAIQIGELGMASSPCETFVETGLAIKEASPQSPCMVIELANDYCGYLPTAEHHRLGGYETWRARSSFLDTKAEPLIRETAVGLLKSVSSS